jgi:hypothetical protein
MAAWVLMVAIALTPAWLVVGYVVGRWSCRNEMEMAHDLIRELNQEGDFRESLNSLTSRVETVSDKVTTIGKIIDSQDLGFGKLVAMLQKGDRLRAPGGGDEQVGPGMRDRGGDGLAPPIRQPTEIARPT